MILHGIYHSLIILLHRPLIADGHLRSAAGPAPSWQRCTVAARHITNIALMYQSAYTLRGAPYLMSYALYIACTIHVSNAAALESSHRGEHFSLLASSLRCLDELGVPNSGVARPTSTIRNLMAAKGIDLSAGVDQPMRPAQQGQSGVPDNGDHDLDAFLRMLSSRSKDTQDASPSNPAGLAGWLWEEEEPFQSDLLYGFMDGYYPMNSDFPSEA
jgi:hypothetical protein